ncbi:MAG: LysM peptidoglycan-binding domain-containing protein [Lachnospiraceae bacterium]|nr:LysM peptidoglycan-binding domain-containing protein [Lachnospiraceae bacterium]
MYEMSMADRMEYRRSRREAVRKQQKIRQRMFLIFWLTLLIMFGVGVGFGTLLTRAESPTEAYHKYYANIEIQRGDTLWGIADDYMDTVHYTNRTEYLNEIMKINDMVDSKLITGQKIIVPYFSDQVY